VFVSSSVSSLPVRITFVRHGESLANRATRWQGQGDSPLSELGVAQARALGKRLGTRKFDRFLASDLSRAADTAAATGFTFDKLQTWREFDVGAWEGLTREEVLERFPAEMEQLKNGEDIPLGGGESHLMFATRIDAALDRLLSELAPGSHALVVCHGGVIGCVIARALGLRGKTRWPLWRAANTSITELSFCADGNSELAVFNDTLHLASLSSWPVFEDVRSCFALLSDSAPAPEHGSFAAHYDGATNFERLARARADGESAEDLSTVLATLHARHPDDRVSLSLRAELIRAWVEDTVWLGGTPKGRILTPPRGAVSHVGYVGGRAQLLDYGVGNHAASATVSEV
jgi:broad specificity phosphatase PhoE